jgi:predicted DsbA family dithiol-disulfide isomerase
MFRVSAAFRRHRYLQFLTVAGRKTKQKLEKSTDIAKVLTARCYGSHSLDASRAPGFDSMMFPVATAIGGSLGQPLEVDIVSDVVCPWCIIGYKQLMKALAALPGQFDVTLRWHPFELNPHMPEDGQDLREHLAQKYGTTPAQSQGARARLTALGSALGFTFDYFEGMRIVNTFRAHQLLHWAAEQGRQTELKLALFEAFFTRREDVNDPETLADVAARAGLDRAQAGQVLASARYASAVRQEQQHWLEQDVHAVPTFYFQQQYCVPGAQEAEAFVRLLHKLR